MRKHNLSSVNPLTDYTLTTERNIPDIDFSCKYKHVWNRARQKLKFKGFIAKLLKGRIELVKERIDSSYSYQNSEIFDQTGKSLIFNSEKRSKCILLPQNRFMTI